MRLSATIVPLNSTSQISYDFLVWHNPTNDLHQMRGMLPLWLFNTPTHIEQQADSEYLTFVLTDTLTHTRLHGIFHVFINPHNQLAQSPLQAPFGSFEVAEHVGYEVFGKWVDWIENYLQELGIKKIIIKHYPECYDWSRAVFVKRALLRKGFRLSEDFENQYIDTNNYDFHPSERRRLRKCIEAGFVFEQVANPPLAEVYQFIAENRESLGYTMTFSYEQLQQWFTIFPNDFLVFWVKDKSQIIALTIAVRVGKEVLYNFCPASNIGYRAFSPSVLLHQGLVNYCQENVIATLDLGISVDAVGNPKPSLVRFKRNIGAKSCRKYWFEKMLH